MRKSKMLCLDASMVVRLVASPEDETIESLFDGWQDRQLLAPLLLLYEVTNALHRYHQAGYFDEAKAENALQAALAVPIELIADRGLHIEARKIASSLELPAAYDAHYLALAVRTGAELWTADRRLAKKAREYRLTEVHFHAG